MLYCALLCFTVANCALLCFTLADCALLCFTIANCALLCFTLADCALLCFTVRNCALLCFTLADCALLCFTIANCALLCFTVAYCALLCFTLANCALLCFTLADCAYTGSIFPLLIGTLVLATFCVIIQAVATLLPLRGCLKPDDDKVVSIQLNSSKHRVSEYPDLTSKIDKPSDGITGSGSGKGAGHHGNTGVQVANKQNTGEELVNFVPPIVYISLAVLLVILVVLIMTLWTILVSSQHKLAVDDLMLQLINSTDTIFEASLVDALKAVKEATNTWQLTGAISTGSELTRMSSWSAPLLRDFQSSAGLGALRFATTTGLEQSTNSTTKGIRVLAREFRGASGVASSDSAEDACLTEYMADGITPSVGENANAANW